MDKYRIDSQKLLYHVPRVNKWLQGEIIYPIYIEISPSGACNQRCTFCGLDFIGYQPRYLDLGILKERLSELASLGVKSIMYSGEGDPFLHRHIVEIINYTKKAGIDTAITTNGVLFDKEVAEETLGDMEWIKVSINGATKETYAKVHRSSPDDFDKVFKNMSYAVELKRKNNYICTLGMQLLLLPENYHEAIILAQMAKDIGIDYLVLKPYSQHPQSKTTIYASIKYDKYEYLKDELEKFNTNDFSVIFRIRTMKKWDEGLRNYEHCFALPFWSYIDAGGDVWGCGVFHGDAKFLYGNIYECSFQEIWKGEKRLQSLRWSEEKLDVSSCRVNCRMDEINRYLWNLKNPPEHVNFI